MINRITLMSLSKELNRHNIIWGIGGSYLLQLHNLYSDPNDLDLWVQPSDIQNIREIFKDFKEIETDIPLPKELHFKMMYYDIEVDFVACFITKPNKYQFTYNIEPENIKMVDLDGMKIPCTYLEDWYIVYRLLNRNHKADLIQKVFSEKKIPLDEHAIQRAIDNKQTKIPIRLKKDVYELITLATQMTMFDYDR